MIWTLYVWATFLTPRAEALSDFRDRHRCDTIAAEWTWRMLAYRDSQHFSGNIVAYCSPKPLGQLP